MSHPRFRLALAAVLAVPGWVLHAEVSDLAWRDGSVHYTVSREMDVTITLCEPSGGRLAILFAGRQVTGAYQFRFAEAAPSAHGKFVLRVDAERHARPDPSFGENGCVQLGNPCDVALAPDGSVLVLERKRPGDAKAGVCRLTGQGRISCFVELPVSGQWLALDSDGSVFVPTARNTVQVLGPDGKPVRSIQANAPTGGALGPNHLLFVRTANGKGMQVFDTTKDGASGLVKEVEPRKDGPVLFGFAPLFGLYAGPSVAAGKGGRLYLTEGQLAGSSRGTFARIQYDGSGFQRGYDYQRGAKDCIGLSLDEDGMIYVAERGTSSTERDDRIWAGLGRGGQEPSRLSQFWDNEEQLNLVTYWQFPEVRGLRDVAVSPDGALVYLLEDGDNFAYREGRMVSPTLDVQGQARLWRYKLSYRQSLTIPVQVE